MNRYDEAIAALLTRMHAATLLRVAALLLLAMPLALGHAQGGFGKLDPTPPAGITTDEIVKRFAARETEFDEARRDYIFRQTVKVDVINDDNGKILGEYQQITDITSSPEGRREEHVIFAPPSTMDNAGVMMTPADFEEIEHRLPFVLTEEDLPQYDVTYTGRQKVDEVDAYVFSVAPKRIEKNHRYFAGKIWVDQLDFEIVLINGKTVPQDERPGHEDLQPPFTTYYEQIDGDYWFPTYTKAEGVLHFAAQKGALSGDVHLRSTVRYTDYKRFRARSRIIYNGKDITNDTQPDNQTPPQSQDNAKPLAPAAPTK
jgi:hypothetical protein